MSLYNKITFIVFFFFITHHIVIANPVLFTETKKILIGKNLQILEDKEDKLSPEEAIKSNLFTQSTSDVPNLGSSTSSFWIKFTVIKKNKSDALLEIAYPMIDEVILYTFVSGKFTSQIYSIQFPFHSKKYKHPNYIFNLPFNENSNTSTYLLKIKSNKNIILPISIASPEIIFESLNKQDIIFGIYSGAILIMVLYYIFIYFTIREKSYLYYLLYVLLVGLTQITIQGYSFQYIWPNWVWLQKNSITLFGALGGIAAMLFIRTFLNLKVRFPFINKGLTIITIAFLLSIIMTFLSFYNIAFNIMSTSTLLFSIYTLFILFKCVKTGNSSVKFLLSGWLLLLTGISLFILKDYDVLPYNGFTKYIMQIASFGEIVLLSIALADRINVLKKENDHKKAELIEHLEHNEEILSLWKEAVLNAEKLRKESFRNQVNPHFLFNSLNVLTELLYENQEQAAKFVNQLAQVYRYVLEHKDKEVVQLKTELEFINAFIFLLQIRFDKNLLIKNNIQTTENVMIPPLTLQLLIENAIKHNIVSEEYPLSIEISLWDDYITVKNIVKMKAFSDRSTGIGLKNIEERYKFLSDKKVIIESEENLFIVKVPLLHVL